MEFVKNIMGIYFFQRDSYLRFIKENLLPIPYAIILLCVYHFSTYKIFLPGGVSLLSLLIGLLYSIFIIYLLADLVYSEGRKYLQGPKTKALFCLYTLLLLPGFIFDLIIRFLIRDFPFSQFSLITFGILAFGLLISWYLFGIKTLYELSWKVSLKFGLKVLAIFTPLVLFIYLVIFFFTSTLGIIDLPLPPYYKFLFGL